MDIYFYKDDVISFKMVNGDYGTGEVLHVGESFFIVLVGDYSVQYSFSDLVDYEVKPRKIGRPSKGVTKKVSITLPAEDWEIIEDFMKNNDVNSKSQYFRELFYEWLGCVWGDVPEK